MVGGKTGKYIIGFAVFFLLYFSATLVFIDRGNTIYSEDAELFYLAIMEKGGHSINNLSTYDLLGPQIASQSGSGDFNFINQIDYMFSIAYWVMNEMSDGWLEHLLIIMSVEQIELLGLLVLYRSLFKPIKNVQVPN